ncbi:MAG: hypothetical protein IT225_06610 [Flavobacteriales bacterium]|nr:hypothetical protein [Flavobacteriales bacterium]
MAILYDLNRPHDVDHLRDVGAAQNILDGGFGQDPLYLGEATWYPPLVPLFLAGLSSALELPAMVVGARVGIHLSLLPLAAFVFMLWRTFGRTAAVTGTLGYLYLIHGDAPTWLAPSLSPYLFAICAMHGAFSLGLYMAFVLARGTAKLMHWCLAGLLVAFTFQGHPSTAMILCILLGSVGANQLLKALGGGPGYWQPMRNLGAFMLIALLGAWILLAPMIEAYGMHSQNPYSTTWQMDGLLLKDLARTLFARPLLANALIAIGFIGVLRRLDRSGTILLFATAVIIALLLWSSVSAELANRYDRSILISFVPAYHFFFYLELIFCVYFAVGGWMLAKWTAKHIQATAPSFVERWRGTMRVDLVPRTAVLLGLLGLVALAPYANGFVHRKYTSMVRKAAARPADDYAPAFEFVLTKTLPTDVFLTNDRVAMDLISPAGRKVVATNRYFSNPYVDLAPRAAARDSMFKFIQEDRVDEFLSLAATWKVRFVVTSASPAPRWSQVLHPVHVDPRLQIHRIAH